MSCGFNFYLHEALDNLSKNKFMTFASSITLASCIFILIISFCISTNINNTLNKLNNNIGLSIIVSESLPNEKINNLYKKIYEKKYVSTVRFISKDDALKDFEKTLGEGEAKKILDGFKNDNPLPRSFDIKLKDNSYYAKAISDLEKLKSDGVEKIKHAQRETNILLVIKKAIYIISTIIIIYLGISSIIIITNTIKLAVNNRKDEISIMKYIGATNWFIRWPFVIEGMIIGFIGSIFPIIVSWIFYDKFIEITLKYFPEIRIIFSFENSFIIFCKLAPIALASGILVGILGSATSIKKYLNV